jgi:N-acetylneuraminic acid mutarotase
MAVTVGHKIYIFNESNTFEYDPLNDRYAPRANAPVARGWATCALVKVGMEDRIYIIGGLDSAFSDATNTNYYYLPASNKWIGPCASAPYRAYGVTRDNPVWKNRIYFGFGHAKPDLFFKDVYIYDPENDNWAGPLDRARFERDGVACAVADGSLYVIGGRSEPNDATAFGLPHNERLEL